MPTATESFKESAGSIGDFASTIAGAISKGEGDTTQAAPPVKEAPVKEAPVKEAPVKEAVATEVKTDDTLSNPNLGGIKTEEIKGKKDEHAEEEMPKGMTSKAQETWKSLKTSQKQAAAERDAIKTEFEALKKQVEESSKNAPELEALKRERDDLRKQLQDYEGEMAVYRVESTKRYKDAIAAPLAAVQSTVDDLAKRYEVSPDTLMRALQQPDAAKRADELEDITSDFKRVDQLEIVQAAKEYHRLQKEAAAMREDAGKRLEEITREEDAQNEQMAAQTIHDYRNSVAEEAGKLQQHIPYIRFVDGQDKWNEHVKQIVRNVESTNVNELPVEDVAKARLAEAFLPEILSVAKHYETQNKALHERADKAEKQLAAYVKSAPGAGAGSNKTALEGGGEDEGSFSGIIGKMARGQK